MANDLKMYVNSAERRNNDVFWYNYNRLKQKAISMFEWVNLPESINERYLETMLCEQGFLCFFKDDVTGMENSNMPTNGEYLALQCTLGGRFNVYNIPTIYNIFTASGYRARRTMEDAVIIWNNYMHTPTVPLLMYHAQNITNVERTIENNLNHLKQPFIYQVPQNLQLSVKKLIERVIKNEPAILTDANIDTDSILVHNTISPNNTLDLYTLKKRYYNECLTDLGIDNVQTEKKERLVSGEVTGNNEDVYINRMNMLNARKDACKQINKMFGLNIDVKFRYEDYEEDMLMLSDGKVNEYEVGGLDGKIYD